MDVPSRLPPRMQVALARERDQPLSVGSEFLGLRRGRLDPPVPKQIDGQVPKGRAPVCHRA
jgi:hypothetical protein